MLPLIEKHQKDIEKLCSEFKVKRLELFGSAAGEGFDAAKSDIDFLVEFEICTPEQHAARYFGLLAALQDLFARDIDLVEIKAVRNPYFRKDIESSRIGVYGE